MRYFLGVRAFLREALSMEEARALVQNQLDRREDAFLECIERAVYARPQSPYRRLLLHAGIELADLRRMVQENGLEATLERLCDAGVYVSEGEFKGRVPIRRADLEFRVKPSDFNNPLLKRSALERQSSGSTGPSASIGFDLGDAGYRAAQMLLANVLRIDNRPVAMWNEVTIRAILWFAKFDRTPVKAFTTVGLRRSRDGLRYAMLLYMTLLAGRLAGRPLPRPEVVGHGAVVRIARWLAQKKAAGTPVWMSCHSGPAVRICLAAREHGLNISETHFHIGAEPYTPAKARIIESVGATTTSTYSMGEAGMVGTGCATPIELDDVHLMTDKLAMIQRPHITPAGETVGALVLTSLLPTSPKLLLNTFSGDYATVTQRQCGCLLGEMGFTTHLSDIRSYEKLTGEGVTFRASQLYDLVESELPSRFGGQMDDYQLVEEESEQGLTRVSIVVSPRVGPVDEPGIIEAVLKALDASHANAGGDLMVAQWRQGKTLRVVRREPEMGRNSKILPLRIRPKVAEPPTVTSR